MPSPEQHGNREIRRSTADFHLYNVVMVHQEIEWVILAISERWKHACEDLEPQIFLVA